MNGRVHPQDEALSVPCREPGANLPRRADTIDFWLAPVAAYDLADCVLVGAASRHQVVRASLPEVSSRQCWFRSGAAPRDDAIRARVVRPRA
jgi:hypothetical protein